MFNFHKKSIVQKTRSPSTQILMYIEILDECRKIVPYDEFKHVALIGGKLSVNRRLTLLKFQFSKV